MAGSFPVIKFIVLQKRGNMNKRQHRGIALLLAGTMALSSMSYVVNNNQEKVSAAKINVFRTEGTRVSSGSAIDDPNAEIIDISIEQKGDKSVELSWASYEGATLYTLFYAKGDSDTYNQVETDSTNMKMKLSRGKKYTVCLVAFSEDGQVLARTEKIEICIPGKNSISFTRQSIKKVKISWNKSAGADKYILYRKINNSKFKKIAKTKKLKFIDKKVRSGKKYKYYVEAVNIKDGNKYSTVSNAKNFRIANFVSTGHQKYSYNEMSRDIKSLKNTYSDYVNVKILGKSNDKRNMYDVIIGNPKAKKTMLIVSSIHAREYMTSQLCMAQIEHYLKNYNGSVNGVKIKRTLNKIAIHYIPMANPDGVTISQFGFSKIRNKKLRAALRRMSGASHPSTWKANARGVDLNRNFKYNYYAKYGGPRGESGYTGSHVESEPETRAIVKLIKKLKKNTNFRGSVNYHAMGSIAFGGVVGPTKVVTTKMYRLARSITGYASSASYEAGRKSVGALREYTMYTMKIPSITLEIGVGGCPLPTSQFPSVWKRNFSLVIREAKLLA